MENWKKALNKKFFVGTVLMQYQCQINQTIQLSFEYLSLLCIWLYLIIISRTQFTVNPHTIFAWFSKNSLLNVKELLPRNRRDIWSLSDCIETRTHNHLVRKRTLNHLPRLIKWLSWVKSTYLFGAFDCIFLSCHVRVSERIHTL